MWIDTHTHLDSLESVEEAVKNAELNKVSKIITIGTGKNDHFKVLELSKKYKNVYCTLGVHPHEAENFDPETESFMLSHLTDPKVVGVGEIGLDYYYDNAPKELQKEVFKRQLQIAKDFNLPVEIHAREAEDDIVALLTEFKGQVSGIIHCFSGSQNFANEVLSLGYNLSISGIVTFKKADQLRDIVKNTPVDRLHIETDAPYLTPIPFRGKKNQPSYVVYVAEKVAEIKNLSLDELSKQLQKNTHSLFKKIKEGE
ncbi:MAG: TatD family hydrolase [Bdellovibrionaceae bacterium]|nr:TatD family hydrolase [Pseudobdellovibrionaceae bacterium]